MSQRTALYGWLQSNESDLHLNICIVLFGPNYKLNANVICNNQLSQLNITHLRLKTTKQNRNETKLYIIDNKTLNLKLTCE